MVKVYLDEKTQSSSRGRAKGSSEMVKQDHIWQGLESADPEMTSSMALNSLHHFIKVNKVPDINKIQKKSLQILKICKLCDKWEKLRSIKTCQVCQDHYHKSCYNKPMSTVYGKFVCQPCLNVSTEVKICKVCNRMIDQMSKTANCEYCNNEYHSRCTGGEEKICKRCKKIRQGIEISKEGKKIKKGKGWKDHIKNTNRNLRDMFLLKQIQKEEIVPNSETRVQRKGCYFKAMTMLNGHKKEIACYKDQLLKAIQAREMKYCEDLKDIQFHIGHMKEGNMNFGLQGMSQQEEIQYLKYKDQPIGPFKIVVSKKKGYGVVAGMPIPKKSIICEYAGEIVTLRQCHKLNTSNPNDSAFDLWVGRNSDQKLIIRPQKWTNIARFINGVKDSSSKANLQSLKLCYGGLPVVLLIANRNIEEGQSLCYDYNAGNIPAKYDTSGFVE